MNRFTGWMLSALLSCSAAGVCVGCENAGVLQDATAVQLETALISMMGGLLRTLVYNAMDIPGVY